MSRHKQTAIVGTDLALIRIEANENPAELVIEDDLDRAVIHLNAGIALEIIAKLTGWLEATETAVEDVSPEVLEAAFRDVYMHIFRKEPKP